MASFTVSFLGWSLFILLLGYVAVIFRDFYIVSREQRAIDGFESILSNFSPNYSRIAVGINADVDVITSATAVLKILGANADVTPKNHDTIKTMEELTECLAAKMMSCAAAERYVSDKKLFDKILAATSQVSGTKYEVGGNAAIIGIKMLKIYRNAKVLLGGPVGQKLRSLLSIYNTSDGDGYITAPSHESTADEYHIILEYSRGDKWGNIVSPCANRFIITHDEANSKMSMTESFFELTQSFDPDLIVFSGLHMLDSQESTLRKERIAAVKRSLEKIPKNVPIHLELASISNKELIKDIVEIIFPLVDSVGLNEQELASLSTAIGGPFAHGSDLSEWPAEIAVMGDVLQWVLSNYGMKSRSTHGSRLSRIHFHSLTYHIIASYFQRWQNCTQSVVAGSRSTTQEACGKVPIDARDVEVRAPKFFAQSVLNGALRRKLSKYDNANPTRYWSNDGIDFCFSVVLVCKVPVQTVGLGDAISASGLQYSSFLYGGS